MADQTAVVMFSGGAGSYAAAKRAIDRFSAEATTLLFADVKGVSEDPDIGEDEDCYRFIDEAAAALGVPLVRVSDGRTIWEVFHDDRFLGNARLANCSKFLKQRPARRWLDEHRPGGSAVVVVGIDWSEGHRLRAISESYAPFPVWAPMCDPPYLDRNLILDEVRADGLEPPRMYRQGFPHANCGGGCVRAGHAQFRHLLSINPGRYAVWERKEQELREFLGKDVAILRDRSDADSRPVTLREFRERQGCGETLFDEFDFGGCGCFV